MSILVNVCSYNRLVISRMALHSLWSGRGERDVVQVYDDHSTEYAPANLAPFCDNIAQEPTKFSLNALRHLQLTRFLESGHEFLYLSDNDAIHDTRYRAMLLGMYGKYGKAVCLYNSFFHSAPALELADLGDALLRKICPGISVFLDRAMVERVLAHVGRRFTYAWDYELSEVLEEGVVTTKTSYVEHYGKGGVHNADYERDRAQNPCEGLAKLRPVLLRMLEQIEAPARG